MRAQPAWQDVFAGDFELPDLGGTATLTARQEVWRAGLADGIYGPIPAPPDEISISTHVLPGTSAKHVTIEMRVQGRTFSVDAALWCPKSDSPAPLIAGLSFMGPIGVLDGDAFPIDPDARVYTKPELGAPRGRLDDVLRGAERHRWPVDVLTDQGFAVLISCYGSWAPDAPEAFNQHGLRPLLGVETGAISLWAWVIQRLVDVAHSLPEVDASRVTVAGHSRLGKAALWAAAHDTRIDTVFANNAGCGGTAPARHPVGETLAQKGEAYPHWIKPQTRAHALDQHHLMGCIAPRGLYVASADQDIWADPIGTYIALRKAASLWPEPMDWPPAKNMWHEKTPVHHPSIGHHIRQGDHEILLEDWEHFLRFLKGSAASQANLET